MVDSNIGRVRKLGPRPLLAPVTSKAHPIKVAQLGGLLAVAHHLRELESVEARCGLVVRGGLSTRSLRLVLDHHGLHRHLLFGDHCAEITG